MAILYEHLIFPRQLSLTHHPADALVYEGIARACAEKGYISEALEYLQKAADVCFATKHYERLSAILSQLKALEGGVSLASQLEQRLKDAELPTSPR